MDNLLLVWLRSVWFVDLFVIAIAALLKYVQVVIDIQAVLLYQPSQSSTASNCPRL